jgi:ribosomal protein S18 acetylase RimI-like enzyme
MNIATLNDFDVIKSVFAPHQKTYFPHIRSDYIQRKIESGNVIYEDGVVIIFGVYKRKQKIGTQQAERGDAHIGQIVTVQQQGNGNATKALNKFFTEMNTKVWLTVRAENTRARAFYEKNGMKNVGDISWSDGKIPGVIYLYTV